MNRTTPKRFWSLLLTLVMICNLFMVVPASATDAGSGTETTTNVIEIGTADELIDLSTGDFAKISEATIVLTNDIDMAGQDAISPIGQGSAFNGTFDGQGYVIRNLQIKKGTGNCTGLFGQVAPNGMVCDLGLENVTVNGDVNTGTIAGALLGTVTRCAVTGSVTGWRYTGGIAGMLYGGTIEDCWVDLAFDGSRYCGGLFGGTHFDTEYLSENKNKCLFTETPATGGETTVCNNLVMGTLYAHVRSAGLVGTMDHVDSRPLAAFEGNVSRIDSLELERQETGENYYGPLYANWSENVKTENNAPNNLYSEDISYIYQKTTLAASDTKTEWLSNQASATADALATKSTYEALGWDFENTWYWDEERDQPMLQGMAFYKVNKVREVHIDTADEFLALCSPENFTEISNDIIYLDADIDMMGQGAISPIGGNLPFNGTFDGQGHVIKNLTIVGVSGTNLCTGLFGYVGTEGKITDLGLDCVNVTGHVNTGAIAGVLLGSVSECYVTGDINGTRYTGGIAGMLHAGTIENCWVDAEFSTTRYGGGLFGGTDYKTQPNPTKVESPLKDWSGPITDKAMVIRNNLVLGTNNGNNYSSAFFGSMVGKDRSSPLKSFEGNVSWMESVSVKSNNYYGPFYAWWAKDREDKNPIIKNNVYWDGMTFKGASVSGLEKSGIMSGSSADGVAFVDFDSLGFETKTTDELSVQSTYEALGWDFEDTWVWSDTLGHPVLQGQTAPTDPNEQKKYPASLVTTYVGSPKTSRSFTWNTINTIDGTIVQAVAADDYSSEADFTSADAVRVVGTCYELKDKNEVSTGRNIHKATLTGLTAGTTYYYRVGDGTYWSPVYTFETEPEGAESFTFFSVTDTQDQKPNSSSYNNYAATLEHATKNYSEGAFIVHTGDVIQNNSSEDYDEVYSVTSQYVTDLPSMVAPGNHELKKDDKTNDGGAVDPVSGLNNFKAHYQYPNNGPVGYKQTVYSFTYGDAYFAILNSNAVFYGGAEDYTAQIEWLKQDIAENGADKAWKIVALHHGPYNSSGKIASNADESLIAALESVDVDLVLSGHYHVLMRSYPIKNGAANTADSSTATSTDGIIYYSPGASNTTCNNSSGDKFALTTNSAGTSLYGAITITEDSMILNTHSIKGTAALDSVEISKPETSVETVPTAVSGLVYNGQKQTLISAGTATNGTMLYSLDGKTYSETIPTGANAGTYTVYYKAGGKDYSDTEPQTIEVTIAPKDITNAEITLGAALTYNGSEQTQSITSVKADGLDVTYTVTGNTGTNAGSYELTVTGTDNFTGTATKAWSIAQAPVVDSDSDWDNGPDLNRVVVQDTESGTVISSHKHAAKGETITITVTPDTNYKLEDVIVTDKTGKKIDVTKTSDGKYTFKMPDGKVTVETVFEWDNPFTDVAEGEYYYDAVQWALENGITAGTSATTFGSGEACTRAQAVTFLWNAAGKPTPETSICPFEDVKPGAYYYNAVLWAVENGITSGTSATAFSPDMTVSRAHNVTFLWRWADSLAAEMENPFTDVTAEDYYYAPVLWAAENGITSGTSATTFGPHDPCLRSQIITFLYRLLAD